MAVIWDILRIKALFGDGQLRGPFIQQFRVPKIWEYFKVS